FAGAVVGTVMRLAADGDAGAGAGPQDDGENHIVAGARAVGRFGGREAVGVVFDADLAPDGIAQILFHRLAEQPGGTCPLAAPAYRFEAAGNADADRSVAAGFRLQRIDQLHDDADAAGIVVTGRIAAQPRQFAAVPLHGDGLDLRTTPGDPRSEER